MLRPSQSLDPYLARPFWLHRIRDGEDGEEVALLVEPGGQTAALLGRLLPGQSVGIFGPCGRGVTLKPGVRSLLLVADGAGFAPLVWLAVEEAARGRSVTLLLGERTAERVYPLPLLDPQVEVAVATDDGSAGRLGSVTALVAEYAGWADEIVLSGPNPLYPAVAAVLRDQPWRRPCQALIAPRMPCGTGLCGSCLVRTRRHGVKLACVDGPAFDLRELM
jgi:dihydroorotate dehydrogenase electron transfer subunit